jgi:hypothetical protein
LEHILLGEAQFVLHFKLVEVTVIPSSQETHLALAFQENPPAYQEEEVLSYSFQVVLVGLQMVVEVCPC